MRKLAFLPLIVLADLALVAACGDDDDDGNGNGNWDGNGDADGGAAVSVDLREWAVAADPASVSAGSVTFDVENIGPEHEHEFVVIRTDLAPDALPTGDDGAVLEDGEGVEVVDEVEELAVGDTASLTVDLEAGSYALICNIVDEHDGETFVHYDLGMRTAFTVE